MTDVSTFTLYQNISPQSRKPNTNLLDYPDMKQNHEDGFSAY